MTRKTLFLGLIGAVAVLAALGLWRETTPTSAGIPLPVQPFSPDSSQSGMTTMALGATPGSLTQTIVTRGQRIAVPWIFNGPAFGIVPSKDDVDDVIGGITAQVDAQCDSDPGAGIATDWFATSASTPGGPFLAYDWVGTPVNATLDAAVTNSVSWLTPIMPPYPWINRHTARSTAGPPAKWYADTFWLAGQTAFTTTVYLNTVYTSIPWSPNGGATEVTTRTNGDPRAIVPARDLVCIDSPQSSTSKTNLYSNPPLLGDSGAPCSGGNCAEASVASFWSKNQTGAAASVPVTAILTNAGPNVGNFSDHWEIEVANTSAANIGATWVSSGTTQMDTAVNNLAVGVSTATSQNMAVTCTGNGAGVIVLKNILWPVAPTQDYYPDNNAAVFSLKVACGTPAGTVVDKQVIRIQPVSLGVPTPGPLPVHPKALNMVVGQVAKVNIDELTSNTYTANVPGTGWLVAEAADLVAPLGTPDISMVWSNVTGIGVSGVVIGGASATFNVDEAPGQTDVLADLTLGCLTAGRFSAVVKGIDVPGAGYIESKASDNVQRTVITVNCFASAGDLVADGKDDGAAFYPRWTIFASQPDSRAAFADPPSFVSDASSMNANGESPSSSYVERVIEVGCYWHDVSGCAACDGSVVGHPNDGYIDAEESWNDPDLGLLGGRDGVDPDHDCLMDASKAQPGQPVDFPNVPADLTTNCAAPAWTAYSGPPTQVANKIAADRDCDGVVDGVEAAFGSNPVQADSDTDGANDYVEMFQFTNPNNPDTDGDGLLDKPENNYITNGVGVADPVAPERGTDCASADALDNDGDGKVNDGCPKVGTTAESGAQCTNAVDDDTDGFVNDGCPAVADAANADDNCPSVYNPDQTNTDGQHRVTGPVIGGGTPGIASNPNQDKMGDACDPDDDNDGLLDGSEVLMNGNPLKADSDADGYVNDGCPAVGAPETGAQCLNRLDDDTDGKVNDGCPQFGQVAETSVANCGNSLDDDSDGVVDGVEAFMGTNINSGKQAPGAMNGAQLRFFRACRWNLPLTNEFPLWNVQYSTPTATRIEWDVDGDGVYCYQGIDAPSGTYDDDNDNGFGAANPAVEITDEVEIKGYYTNAALQDTDGDGCADWFEIADINGSRNLTVGDLYLVATAPSGDPDSDRVLDINKDGKQSVGDLYLEAVNSCGVKTGVGGCPTCPSEN